mgnify:CR=1 FL=1
MSGYSILARLYDCIRETLSDMGKAVDLYPSDTANLKELLNNALEEVDNVSALYETRK